MGRYLGLDTSNYTTSTALYTSGENTVLQEKQLLPVKSGALGLRQSDAVFSHVRQLGERMEALFAASPGPVAAIGVSTRPRPVEGSYMPCFTVGEMAARSLSSAMNIPLHPFSHQEGHIAAALWSVGALALLEKPFIAFHLSGGTTECLHCQGLGDGIAITQISATTDLNAGQGIDRVGLRLGLTFPCGPALEALAQTAQKTHRPKVPFVDGNPSLSGLENQCAALMEKGEPPAEVAAYAIAYIQAAVDEMTRLALQKHGDLPLIYAGGVMSNRIIASAIRKKYGGRFAIPALSSDNGAGVAILAAAKEGIRWQG